MRNSLRIQNPLGEDTSIMRTTALPSMLDILSRNNAYHNKSAKLYELAKVYIPVEGEALPEEPKILVLGTYGAGESFFTIKGELEAILYGLRMPKASYVAEKNNPSYHPGRCAKVTISGVVVFEGAMTTDLSNAKVALIEEKKTGWSNSYIYDFELTAGSTTITLQEIEDLMASLADASAVVLAEGVEPDTEALDAAMAKGVTLLRSELDSYSLCVRISKLLEGAV